MEGGKLRPPRRNIGFGGFDTPVGIELKQQGPEESWDRSPQRAILNRAGDRGYGLQQLEPALDIEEHGVTGLGLDNEQLQETLVVSGQEIGEGKDSSASLEVGANQRLVDR